MLVKGTAYYVTAIAVPRGAASVDGLPRTDMAKFYSEASASEHLEKLRGPAFYDLQVEPRDEMVEESEAAR